VKNKIIIRLLKMVLLVIMSSKMVQNSQNQVAFVVNVKEAAVSLKELSDSLIIFPYRRERQETNTVMLSIDIKKLVMALFLMKEPMQAI